MLKLIKLLLYTSLTMLTKLASKTTYRRSSIKIRLIHRAAHVNGGGNDDNDVDADDDDHNNGDDDIN